MKEYKVKEPMIKSEVLKSQSELLKREYELREISSDSFLRFFKVGRIKQGLKNSLAYLVGRRNLKRLYSRKFKKKQAENDLIPLVYKLYNLGFMKARSEIEALNKYSKNKYVKRASNWELALWHANKQTKASAPTAIYYLEQLKSTDSTENESLAILLAEQYEKMMELEKGKKELLPYLNKSQNTNLRLAYANLIEDKQDWLAEVNKVYKAYELRPIEFKDAKFNYDNLTCLTEESDKVTGPLVTVIIPLYNTGAGVQVAIDSMLNQTWTNIELIVVDDCSTDNTYKYLEKYIEEKEIKYYKTPKNSGPYVARNIGLKHAQGEYVTVNDGDDWSHPQKIERQVKHLIKNKELIANTSSHSRLTENLRFYRRGTRGKYLFPNMSSLMFRRKIVRARLGYWDPVRFAADGEFKRRLIEVFGKESVVDLNTGPVSLPRQAENSLTTSSAYGYSGYFMGVRREYVDSFSYTHSKKMYYYPNKFSQTYGMHKVPRPMLEKDSSAIYDIVLAGDFRQLNESLKQTIDAISLLLHQGLSVGLMQANNYQVNINRPIHPRMRKIINEKKVDVLVYGQQVETELLIIDNSHVFEEEQIYLPNISVGTVLAIIGERTKVNSKYKLRKTTHNILRKFNKKPVYLAQNLKVLRDLEQNEWHQIKNILLYAKTLDETAVKSELIESYLMKG